MVAGYAVGGGHILHMVCDITLAADNAVFGQTGPKVGSFDAGYGSTHVRAAAAAAVAAAAGGGWRGGRVGKRRQDGRAPLPPHPPTPTRAPIPPPPTHTLSQMARLVGQKKAREMWFLARLYDARQALRMGLVNAVVPLEQLEPETLAW